MVPIPILARSFTADGPAPYSSSTPAESSLRNIALYGKGRQEPYQSGYEKAQGKDADGQDRDRKDKGIEVTDDPAAKKNPANPVEQWLGNSIHDAPKGVVGVHITQIGDEP
jgi:hypothetical protein